MIISGIRLLFFKALLTAAFACLLWAAAHADTVVVINRADCARLLPHKPADDVTYKPGVDVQGRAVAPADLPGSAPALAIPDEIAIDITVELQKRFGLPADSTLYKPEARIGTVVVKPDGSATFNGQPLTSPEAQALAAACQRQGAAAPAR